MLVADPTGIDPRLLLQAGETAGVREVSVHGAYLLARRAAAARSPLSFPVR
jgi:hypothetical protein